MASTLKVTNIDTPDGTGNITVDRPLSGSGASLTSLPAGNLTGTLPSIDGSALTGISAGADTSLSNLSATGLGRACQAWLNMNGTGTAAIVDSGGIKGVSSITDHATGEYSMTFATAMSNSTYTWQGTCGLAATTNVSRTMSAQSALSTTTFRFQTDYSGVHSDQDVVMIQVFGD
jgi:hypothetical protein